jgi:hypothetical protein
MTTDFAYPPYHDLDVGGHKRQRIGEADQNLWTTNDPLATEVPVNRAFDPVRDSFQGDANFPDPEFFNFQTNPLTDNSSWFPDFSAQSFPASSGFEGTSLLTSPQFDEQNTVAFNTSFHENQTEAQQDLSEEEVETDGHELAQTMEVESSPEPGLSVICFGMVCCVLRPRLISCLTYFMRRSQTFRPIVINQALF